jgi:hypothetical protein
VKNGFDEEICPFDDSLKPDRSCWYLVRYNLFCKNDEKYPMKKLSHIFFSILILSSSVYADEVMLDCETEAVPLPRVRAFQTLTNVTDEMYKDVARLKVNLDGEGKLSIYFEDGEPKILKLTYQNSKGTAVIQTTFEDIQNGKPLVYENPDIPGKAIVLDKGDVFKNGDNYTFNLKVRSKVRPESHTSYPVVLSTNSNIPKLSSGAKSINRIVISPGVSMFRWDGTFKRVEFE